MLFPDPAAWPQDAIDRARPRLWTGRETGFRLVKRFDPGSISRLPESWRLYAVGPGVRVLSTFKWGWWMNAVGMAVVGAGYWGPQLVRNAKALPDTDLKWVCDRDLARARHVVGEQSEIRIASDLDDVLADESVEAVAIATPPGTHAELALRCIEAGRHVLVEKPLADSLEAGVQIVRAAEEHGVVLHCDHTFCYTPAVQKIREPSRRRRARHPLYYDSVRVNLGLVQQEVDVFWDLAPHDISILDFILGEGARTGHGHGQGADPLEHWSRLPRVPVPDV